METSTTPTHFIELARRSARAQFATACPFWFLFGEGQLDRPGGPQRTQAAIDVAEITRKLRSMNEQHGDDTPLLLAIRKTQEAFPSMVTVGRTANNDMVIADVNISKFHAFFKVTGGRVELTDAGSRNGTWVSGRRLQARGQPTPVPPGAVVRFGHVQLTLVDAPTVWDRLNTDDTDW